MSAVDFYFDYSCPWSYLGYTRLKETVKRLGANIEWRPVAVDQVVAHLNSEAPFSRVPADPAKSAYHAADLEAWSDYVGVTVHKPEGWPHDAGLALQGAVIAAAEGKCQAYSDAVFSAYFGFGRDISDQALLAELADSVDIDQSLFNAGLADSKTVAVIEANAQQLVARGGFGVPTMFVEDRMFFGNDRMPLVEFELGQTSGKTFVMPGQHDG